MSYLIFDTETTGFPRKDLPANHPEQARVIQLAALLLDEQFKERACFHTLIKPDGWTISPGAQAVHGISNEDCELYGIPIKFALKSFLSLERQSSCNVAHNLKFDNNMLNLEYAAEENDSFNEVLNHYPKLIKRIADFCTMEATTDICKLPSKRGGYKWPKLKEAYLHCFGEELQDAHDALADCRACAKIFRWLKERDSQPTSVSSYSQQMTGLGSTSLPLQSTAVLPYDIS